MSDIREFLYPLGFLSSLAFGGRFLLQWVCSEIQRKSVVTLAFWRLSLLGNLMLMVHSFIQSQFHVCVIQACNAVISWRNLNLMNDEAPKMPLRSIVKLLALVVVGTGVAFIIQGIIVGNVQWFRLPNSGMSTDHVSLLWHIIGTIGICLFSMRFWVQWWFAEKNQKSDLSLSFWWLSLTGALLSLVYFIRIDDPVNIIGPAVGLIPYVRNLMLIKKHAPS